MDWHNTLKAIKPSHPLWPLARAYLTLIHPPHLPFIYRFSVTPPLFGFGLMRRLVFIKRIPPPPSGDRLLVTCSSLGFLPCSFFLFHPHFPGSLNTAGHYNTGPLSISRCLKSLFRQLCSQSLKTWHLCR